MSSKWRRLDISPSDVGRIFHLRLLLELLGSGGGTSFLMMTTRNLVISFFEGLKPEFRGFEVVETPKSGVQSLLLEFCGSKNSLWRSNDLGETKWRR